MTALSIQPPYPLLTDIDGQPLEDGYIWIGVANLPPIGNPIAVYWDAALTQPAALPVRTRGGYPVNAGTPARLYVGSDYSIQVQNRNGSVVYSAPQATERYGALIISSADVSFLQAGSGAVVRTAQSKMRETVSVKDFGAVGDGVADDYAAIMAAHAAAPDGATILVNGALYFTQPLVFTRRLNWLCEGPGDYFKPNVGAGNDALTIVGGFGAGNVQNKINMYSGAANACRNGIVVDLYWMSTLESRVQVNAAQYAFKVIGALESRFYLKQTPNFTAPGGAFGMSANHLKIEKNTTAFGGPYATNACEFYVNFAGATDGVIHNDMTAEGDNSFSGTIQGLGGVPFSATNCINMSLREMHFESNAAAATLTGCRQANITNVLSASSPPWVLDNCAGCVFINYVGGLTVNANSSQTRLINCRSDSDTYTDNSISTEIVGGGITSAAIVTRLDGFSGLSNAVNFFHNPYNLIWPNGSSAAPAGWSIVSVLSQRTPRQSIPAIRG